MLNVLVVLGYQEQKGVGVVGGPGGHCAVINHER